MTTDDRLVSGASSESPNKSSGDIVERLRLNACRLSHESMDAFHMRRIRVELEAAAEIERLRRELDAANSNHRSMDSEGWIAMNEGSATKSEN